MPLAGGETFCLHCGTRLVPEPEPQQSWAMPGAIIAVIALIAVGGVVFALNQVESDAEHEATKPAIVVERPKPGGEAPTSVATWPAGTSAYTVALAQTPDETTARARATAAVAGGVPAGVLESDAYPSLDPGAWLIFAGRFQTRVDAEEEATRYVAAGFPDAEAVFVGQQPGPSG